MREDFAQEMGLYGAIVVEPSDSSYWPAVDRQLTLTVDDLLVEDGHIAPFNRSGPNFTAMGRFGNVMLINGETQFSGEAAQGEVVRLYLVNTANTRIFNVAVRGARTKLVGGDSGRYERETFIEEVLLAPSERAVLDVLFDTPGEVRLEHRTPDRVYDLGGSHVVTGRQGRRRRGDRSTTLRTDPELTAVHRRSAPTSTGNPTRSSRSCPRCRSCTARTTRRRRPTSARCTRRHRDEPATARLRHALSPQRVLRLPDASRRHRHRAVEVPTVRHEAGALRPRCRRPAPRRTSAHDHGDGLEWEDLMPEINRASDPSNMIWQLVDRETGAENGAIDWAFTVGDRVKIRLVNEMDSDHPMHHPFHIHGAGRFLILSRDDEPESNLVWKDTVLVRAGETVDILLDVRIPGCGWRTATSPSTPRAA